MKVEINIKNRSNIVVEKVLSTEIKDSVYVIYFKEGRLIYPLFDVIKIIETDKEIGAK